MMDTKVAVTGIGVVSPLGIGKKDFSENIISGKSAIDDLTLFEPPGQCERAAEMPDFDYSSYIFSTQPYVDRSTSFALGAARMALDDAGMSLPLSVEEKSVGLCYGTCWGCMDSIGRFSGPLLQKRPRLAQGLVFTHSFPNSTAGLVAIEFGLRGYSLVSAGDRLAGMWAIEQAFSAIREGTAQRILVGASEAINLHVFSSLENNGLLCKDLMPAPLSGENTGTVPGEGSVFVMLERLTAADLRGANVLAIIEDVVLGHKAEHKTDRPPHSIYHCAPGIDKLDKKEVKIAPDAAARITLASQLGDTMSVLPLYSLIAHILTGEGPARIVQASVSNSAAIDICKT